MSVISKTIFGGKPIVCVKECDRWGDVRKECSCPECKLKTIDKLEKQIKTLKAELKDEIMKEVKAEIIKEVKAAIIKEVKTA